MNLVADVTHLGVNTINRLERREGRYIFYTIHGHTYLVLPVVKNREIITCLAPELRDVEFFLEAAESYFPRYQDKEQDVATVVCGVEGERLRPSHIPSCQVRRRIQAWFTGEELAVIKVHKQYEHTTITLWRFEYIDEGTIVIKASDCWDNEPTERFSDKVAQTGVTVRELPKDLSHFAGAIEAAQRKLREKITALVYADITSQIRV